MGYVREKMLTKDLSNVNPNKSHETTGNKENINKPLAILNKRFIIPFYIRLLYNNQIVKQN